LSHNPYDNNSQISDSTVIFSWILPGGYSTGILCIWQFYVHRKMQTPEEQGTFSRLYRRPAKDNPEVGWEE
jgi:magnesium-transporting ATPase (P-type)